MRVFATTANRAVRGGFAFEFDRGQPRQIVNDLANQLAALGYRLGTDVGTAVVRQLGAGLPLWVQVDHEGRVVLPANPPDPSVLLEMPWGIFLGASDPDTVRHQLFEPGEDVNAPPVFTSASDWDVWVDEAARRMGGTEPLASALSSNDILRQGVTQAIRGIPDEHDRDRAFDSSLFGSDRGDESSTSSPRLSGGRGNRPAGDAPPANAAAAGNAAASSGRTGQGRDAPRGGVHPDGDRPADDGVTATDYRITGPLGTISGDKSRAAANLEALETLLEIGDSPATPEQQEILAEYVGWGGMPQIFDETNDSWSKLRERLQSVTTDAEYAAMRASTLNAHYTSVPVVKAMWEALRAAGYDGRGEVLEPACGIGHFVGAGPETQRVTGIELDPLTARIASKLYPRANIVQAGFESVDAGHVPEFDLAVGNPPFGTEKVYDQFHRDLSTHTIHNYFIAKSLRAVRPGGMAAFVVSRYFLDAGNAKTRQAIHQMADLAAAVRLPQTAFAQNAGTSVVADVLVFRKRTAQEQAPDPTGVAWLHTDKHTDEGAGVAHNLNRLMTGNPDLVLGEANYEGKMFRGSCYTVDNKDIPPDDQERLGAELGRRLTYQVRGFQQLRDGPLYAPVRDPDFDTPRDSGVPTLSDLKPDGRQRKMGGLIVHDDGLIYAIKANPDSLRMDMVEKVVPANATDERRLRALLSIRDQTRALLTSEADPHADIVELTTMRDDLRGAVETFIGGFSGAYNSSKNSSLLVDEPDRHLILSLHDSETATHAALLERRVNVPRHTHVKPESVEDAVALSFAERGELDTDFVADSMERDIEDVESDLVAQMLAFRDPGTREVVWRDEYLSGNVREKMNSANAAADSDPEYTNNVIALQQVVPPDIPPEDIYAQLQSPWIPADDIAEFMKDHTGLTVDCVRYGHNRTLKAVLDLAAYWENPQMRDVRMHSQFGTSRMSAVSVVNHLANAQEISVHDYVNEGDRRVRVLNPEETAKAKGKADDMSSAFRSWVWKCPERTKRLAAAYNNVMNSHAVRNYDGSVLQLKGAATNEISLRKNQKDVAFRMVCTDRTLVDHAVGAGKTYSAIAGEMEKQRMGITNKSMFVVPNHLVGHWAQEFQRLYPGADVLTMEPGQFKRDKRRGFLARIATGSWNAIICPQSSFGLIDVSDDFKHAMLMNELVQLQEELREIEVLRTGRGSRAAMSLTVKAVERKIKNHKKKIAELQHKPNVDNLLTWEQLGVDSLVVDEAQEFKNLSYTTSQRNLAGLGPEKGSKKAYDLLTKIRWMDQSDQRTTVSFLTGTPISNTVAEAYHMMNYLAPNALEERGVRSMDLWLRTFAETSSDFEVSVTGMGFKRKNRVRAFHNVPELCVMYREFADVVTNADLDREHLKETGRRWPIPEIADGGPEKVILQKSPELEEKFDTIVDRMREIENRAVDPRQDNVLKCLHDARTNALDIRIQSDDPVPYDDQSKVESAARRIVDIHDETASQNGVQLVFCDLSTPKQFRMQEAEESEKLAKLAAQGDARAVDILANAPPHGGQGDFDVYNELRRRVVELSEGRLKASEFAFIHEAGTSMSKRENLFDRVRKGDVRVLMGSSGKMGTGMNVQNRLVALHHLDVPWRPADLEQREGRILRQGNDLHEADPDNFSVRIVRYATKATSDTKFWQTLETKAKFIDQFRKGNCGASDREMEDIGETVLSYSEMKALSADNPLILKELELDNSLRSLQREERSHTASTRKLKEIVANLKGHEPKAKRQIVALARTIKTYEKNPHDIVARDGAKFVMPEKPEEGEKPESYEIRRAAIRDQIGSVLSKAFLEQKASLSYLPKPTTVKYRGFDVRFLAEGMPGMTTGRSVGVTVHAAGADNSAAISKIRYHSVDSFSAVGFMRRFSNVFTEKLPKQIKHLRDNIPKNEKSLQTAKEQSRVGFEKAGELKRVARELRDVRTALAVGHDTGRDAPALVGRAA